MPNMTGAYTTPCPTISQNTEAVLRHKAQFYNGATLVALPLAAGTRYIIYSAITNGTYLKIGLSTNGTTIISAAKTYFEFTQTAGPVDLSRFFAVTPFTRYFPPNDIDVYLLILSDAELTISVVEYKV